MGRRAEQRRNAEIKGLKEAEKRTNSLGGRSYDPRYRKYSIQEIEAATDNFSKALKIGEGGYGPVYVGELAHTQVAIKALRPDAAQGRSQFQQEIEVLSCIRHPNMVLLLGACPEYGCLIYEYMANGSLEDRLFRQAKQALGLTHLVEHAIEIGTFDEMLDPAVPDWPVEEALKFAKLALQCAQMRRKDRPDLGTVVLPELNRLRELGEKGGGAFSIQMCSVSTKPSLLVASLASPHHHAVSGTADVGCVGEVVKHERLVDDRFFLICKGQERFRVTDLVRTKPYLVAEVQWLEDRLSGDGEEDMDALATEVESYMKDVIRLSNRLGGKPEKEGGDDVEGKVGVDPKRSGGRRGSAFFLFFFWSKMVLHFFLVKNGSSFLVDLGVG
ncbi:hypothetical protein ACLB2K_072954 [Fragaria x ananassa]